MDEGTLTVEGLGGGGNLPYKVSQVQDAICNTHVYYDDDDAGRRAVEQAENEGLLSSADYNLTTCEGMEEAEFEDMLNVGVYAAAIEKSFGVKLNVKSFHSSKPKWSGRLKKVFQAQGKLWNERVRRRLKALVADSVAEQPENALNEHKRSSFDALVASLEAKLRGE